MLNTIVLPVHSFNRFLSLSIKISQLSSLVELKSLKTCRVTIKTIGKISKM